jgi:hypothetical protein
MAEDKELQSNKADELLDVQSNHFIRYTFTNIILKGKLETKKIKKFDKLQKRLSELLPFKPVGTTMIEDPLDGKVYLSIKPCAYDHSFDFQLENIPNITKNEEKNKKLMAAISMLIYVLRQEYKKFIISNKDFIEELMKLIPETLSDISIKIDPENTTLYIYKDFPLRSGVYLERESYINDRKDTEDVVERDDLNMVLSDTLGRITKSVEDQRQSLYSA